MVSIYFASGDPAASAQSEDLLGRLGSMIADCQPDSVVLLAHVDTREGDQALQLALERLSRISRQLVEMGLPAQRIRTATGAASDIGADVALRQVDIMIAKSAPDPDRPLPGVRRQPPQDT